jgi:hypothetical protein
MKRRAIAAMIAIAFAPVLFSQAKVPPKPQASKALATVKELKGKVEIKASGSGWRPAEAGMGLDAGAWISTGFNATALLDLGTSTLKVRPLTRLQLVDLIALENSVSTTLSLKVGKVNAAVKSSQGVRQDFKVRGPKATAAVRGTEFEFDGLTVTVINGLVSFSNNLGQGRQVGPGEKSSLSAGGLPTTPDQENGIDSVVDPYPPSAVTILAESGAKSKEDVTVTIKWQ